MAWTKSKLFSFVRKCEYSDIRLVSGINGKRGEGRIALIIARYDSKEFRGQPHYDSRFPVRTLRKAFAYAQQRANELDQEVRIVLEAGLREEHGGDEDLFRVASFAPRDGWMSLPVLGCSCCDQPAAEQVVRNTDGQVIIENACSRHLQNIKDFWSLGTGPHDTQPVVLK